MKTLELLAPARTADIGIAAIDCGADAVYLAGPAFGARQAAGNSVEDIARLCRYAHRFGAKVFVTVNTIVFDSEIDSVKELIPQLEKAGTDALIIQDPAVLEMARSSAMALHASTQCAVLTPEKARFLESLGYGRIVLERQLSLSQIEAISKAVNSEIECFVHGALCVSYSGQCYLSEYLTGRSANRGACAQPCRNLYDLEDGKGRTLSKNKAFLSLKDLNLYSHLKELADAGAMSFKIEGRLKNISYVKNVVKAYSEALDKLVATYPDLYKRASYGHSTGGFKPDLDKTFNRGYTSLFIDGKRGNWSSMLTPKSMGELIGTVRKVTADGFILKPAKADTTLSNGDGFAIVTPDGSITGFRADICSGYTVRCKKPEQLREGIPLYRNINASFEKEIQRQSPERVIDVDLTVSFSDGSICASAKTEDGRTASVSLSAPQDKALNEERMLQTIRTQFAKKSSIYAFRTPEIRCQGEVPFMPASFINAIRRELAEKLDSIPVQPIPLKRGQEDPSVQCGANLSYKFNIANDTDRSIYLSRGASTMEQAYELSHREGIELMRSKYCVRHELGLCPKQGKASKAESLYLRNGKMRLCLSFDCARCEMTVSDSTAITPKK